jgi:D-lyxose ketol-isomerase
MKRSRINEIMEAADGFIRSFGFVLPPFAYWTPAEFKAKGAAARHIVEARCGWDITDFGQGRFETLGLFLFTLRNGRLEDLSRGRGMCYAEKLSSTAAAPRWPSSCTAPIPPAISTTRPAERSGATGWRASTGRAKCCC